MSDKLEMNTRNNRRDNVSKLKRPFHNMKLVFYVLCVCGLIYQVITLVVQYSKYKTVINVKFETIKYNRMPAITICYPQCLSMNKTSLKYPTMRPLFDKYKNLLKNASKDDYYDETYQNELNLIYYNFTSFVKIQNLNVAEYYDLMFDYEIPPNSSLFLNNKTSKAIKIILFGLRRYEDGSIEEFNISDTKPIESRYASQ